MGHGNRWGAFAGDAKAAIAQYIPQIVNGGVLLVGPKRTVVWPAESAFPEETITTVPIGYVLQEGPFGLCSISLEHRGSKAFRLMTAFPTPLEGIVQQVAIHEIKEDCFGLEGWIDADTEAGTPLSFFAVDYFAYPERYREGAVVQVSLSGLAYSVRAAAVHEVVIDDPETLRGYREAGVDLPPGEPLRIRTEGAAILFPKKGWEPFDYTFQGPVKQCTRTVHQSRGFNHLLVTVARPDDNDVDMLILAGDHVLDGVLPDVGEDLEGSMCIMGRLADQQWPPPHKQD